MSSGSLASASGGAAAGRKISSGLLTSTATKRAAASASQFTQASAEMDSGSYGSSLRRYCSSLSSAMGERVSKPSSGPSSAGAATTRRASASASEGGRRSKRGRWMGGGRRSPASFETSPADSTVTPASVNRNRTGPARVSTWTRGASVRTAGTSWPAPAADQSSAVPPRSGGV